MDRPEWFMIWSFLIVLIFIGDCFYEFLLWRRARSIANAAQAAIDVVFFQLIREIEQ
jgi:hypothetical protein